LRSAASMHHEYRHIGMGDDMPGDATDQAFP
jgi:hypothetical protein